MAVSAFAVFGLCRFVLGWERNRILLGDRIHRGGGGREVMQFILMKVVFRERIANSSPT